MLFQHAVALLGFAVMAASYSLPGAYERLLFYYSYKLDYMAGRSNIASHCSNSGVCNFDDFIHYIEGRKTGEGVVHITKEEFPPVEGTALKLQKLGKTGFIKSERIIGNAHTYPELFTKLGTNFESLLPKDVKVSRSELEGPELEQAVENIRENILLSLKRVFDGRVRATLESFRPYKDFQVVPANGGNEVDFDATVEANKGGITREKLEKLWNDHLRGRTATEEILRDFKPLADYKPTIKDTTAGEVDLDLTFQEALKENDWMTGKWFRKMYLGSVDGNHQENVKALKKALGEAESQVCALPGSRKRGTMRLAKLQRNPCDPRGASEEEKELLKGETTPPKEEVPNEGELIDLAGQHSKESFDGLLKEFKYESVVKHDQLYYELDSRLPEFSGPPRTDRIIEFSSKIGEGALAAGGLALYGKAVADVFTTNTSTTLDKVAVVTSILPGVGCAVQLADDVQKGHVDGVRTSLCFIGDALALAGFWEVQLVMQVGEELVNWIKAEAEQIKLYDGELLAQKGAEAWLANVKRMVAHLQSPEFFANATTKFSAYQITILYQASQLSGDLHASHKAISDKAGKPDQKTDIAGQIKPELNRHICASIAQSKYQLQKKLESIAITQLKKMEHDFKERFLADWWEAATKPIPVFDISLPDITHGHLEEDIEKARKDPLPLYEDEIKRAMREVIEGLKTPEPCTCLQGSKQARCDWGLQ